MLPLDTLKHIQHDQYAIVVRLNENFSVKEIDALVIPENLGVHDLEQYREHRRRLTGKMTTDDLASFSAYVTGFSADTTPRVFVQPSHMSAVAVLNFGDHQSPGHCDHKASFAPEKSPEYSALLRVAGGEAKRQSQKAAAEWCEDYTHCIRFLGANGDEIIEPAKAIKAIRNIKIDHASKISTGVNSFSTEKSLLESTKVDTSEGLPHFIEFKCQPYAVLAERTLTLRLGTGISNGETIFVLQIIKLDQHVLEMAIELAELVRNELKEIPVLIGSFSI
ncbi:MAG: DUF2303 family protein [Pseudomonadota bacterium]